MFQMQKFNSDAIAVISIVLGFAMLAVGMFMLGGGIYLIGHMH